MKWIYRVFAVVLLAVGCFSFAQDLPELLFFSDPDLGFVNLTGTSAFIGFAFLLLGAMNLLNDRYGPGAPGLRRTTIAANIALTVLCLRIGFEPGSGAQVWVFGAFLVCLSVISAIQRSSGQESPAEAPE